LLVATCKYKWSIHFYWQRDGDGVLLNATRRDEKKTEAPTSFDTFTVSINLPILPMLLLHG
jgi:hypothetical protein